MKTYEKVLVSLRQIIRAIDLHSKEIERKSSLTGPQLLIMKTINDLGSLSAGNIAKEVNLSQATITSIIDRLEGKGLLRRERDTQDKRKVIVSLTEIGQKAYDKAPTLLQENFLDEFEKLEEWEQNLILSSLQRVAVMMNATKLDAAPLLDSTSEAVQNEKTTKKEFDAAVVPITGNTGKQ